MDYLSLRAKMSPAMLCKNPSFSTLPLMMITMYLLCTLHLSILNKLDYSAKQRVASKIYKPLEFKEIYYNQIFKYMYLGIWKTEQKKMSHILIMVFRCTVVNKSCEFNIYWRVLVLHSFNYVVLSPIPFLSWIFKMVIYVSVII